MTASTDAHERTLVGIIQTGLREVWVQTTLKDPHEAWAEAVDAHPLAEIVEATLTEAELDTALHWHRGDAQSDEEMMERTPAAIALTPRERRAAVRCVAVEEACADIVAVARESSADPEGRKRAEWLVARMLESMRAEEEAPGADPERWAALRKSCEEQIQNAWENDDDRSQTTTPQPGTSTPTPPRASPSTGGEGRIGVLKAIVQTMLAELYRHTAAKAAPAFIDQQRTSGEVLAVGIGKALSAREIAAAFEWVGAYHEARRWAREIDWAPIAAWLGPEQLRVARCREIVEDAVDDCAAMAAQIPIRHGQKRSAGPTRGLIAQDLLVARIAAEAADANPEWSWRTMTKGTRADQRVAELPQPWRSLVAAELREVAAQAEDWGRPPVPARKR